MGIGHRVSLPRLRSAWWGVQLSDANAGRLLQPRQLEGLCFWRSESIRRGQHPLLHANKGRDAVLAAWRTSRQLELYRGKWQGAH